jgi:ATP-dependent RNA helicase DDX10/DBP4
LSDDSGSEEDVLVVKRKHNFEEEEPEELEPLEPRKKKTKVLTKVALAKRALKKKIIPNKKILFTEEGEVITKE